jgi:hypothetical protein
MHDDDGLKTFLLCCAGVLISFVLAISSYNKHRDLKIAEAIKAGGDPIAVGCAFDNITATNNQTCLDYVRRLDVTKQFKPE